jgi:hypothetical protein
MIALEIYTTTYSKESMAIKRIQLRGISRTPSDRMTDDGGCAESLNVVLGDAELAPSFVPEDITDELGLPADTKAEKVFVHKTANYENYIAVLEDKIVAYTPQIDVEQPLLVMGLTEGESVDDVASVGNTLIVSTNNNMYYILYRDRAYSILGNKIPFFQIDFEKRVVGNPIELNYSKGWGMSITGTPGPFEDIWFRKGYRKDEKGNLYAPEASFFGTLPLEDEWTVENFNSQGDNTTDGYWFRHFKSVVDKQLVTLFAETKKQNRFSGLMFVRYEIETYSGRLSSMPILMKSDILKINVSTFNHIYTYSGEYGHSVSDIENEAKASADAFNIMATMQTIDNIAEWKDIIQNINIYISIPTNYQLGTYFKLQDSIIDSKTISDGALIENTSSGTIVLGELSDEEKALLEQSALVYQIKSIPLFDNRGVLSEGAEKLIEGYKLELDEQFADTSVLAQQPRLKDDDMKHYITSSPILSTFNNRLLLVQPTQTIGYDYDHLNARIVNYGDDVTAAGVIHTYDVTYILKSATEDKVVTKRFTYRNTNDKSTDIYAFQIFPDKRAVKMRVHYRMLNPLYPAVTLNKYGEFDMYPHPYLDCAYYYGGLDQKLSNLCGMETLPAYKDNTKDDIENKLFVSRLDDPFSFPIESRYTFQSRVLGVAVATTALSQGQFGQFPLYVFTEDGIWAMETAKDGSFLPGKPLPPEVCVNPKSITSVDNGVVFVTDKGVVLLKGSQVMNLSPNMNGKHYTIEGPAQTIIEGQPFFKDLLPSITDATHFMAYVKAASIAYDYAGQRLVFIKEGEDYQYVYKLDTQTWHKVAYGIDMIAPINSFPECSVMGKTKKEKELVYLTGKKDPQFTDEDIINGISVAVPTLDLKTIRDFVQNNGPIDLNVVGEGHQEAFYDALHDCRLEYTTKTIPAGSTCIYNLSTILDAQESRIPTRGVIATRPMDLGEPDVLKTVTDVRIRGQFRKGAAKFILLGSNDGLTFYTLSTLRGRAWKLFRIIILADLEPTERISWIDVQYEPRFTNKLR